VVQKSRGGRDITFRSGLRLRKWYFKEGKFIKDSGGGVVEDLSLWGENENEGIGGCVRKKAHDAKGVD